jgi:hypothetical protein
MKLGGRRKGFGLCGLCSLREGRASLGTEDKGAITRLDALKFC